LGALTWRQGGIYKSEEKFFTYVVAGNPQSLSGHNNLGYVCIDQGRLDEARAQYELSLKINPNAPVALTKSG